MKALSNRTWMGPSTPMRAILGDLVRFVALALAAGIGFALFLTLTVVALTLAAPAAAEELAPSKGLYGLLVLLERRRT